MAFSANCRVTSVPSGDHTKHDGHQIFYSTKVMNLTGPVKYHFNVTEEIVMIYNFENGLSVLI